MGAFSGTLSVTVHGNLESQWTLQRQWTDFYTVGLFQMAGEVNKKEREDEGL